MFFQIAGAGFATLCLCAQTPVAPAPERATVNVLRAGTADEVQKGLPPRTAPTDYPAQGKAGMFTIAAEFAGHGIPAPEGTLSTEDYVVVEVAFYGPPGSHLAMSFSDFSLRINGKKNPAPGESYEHVGANVKDPEWTPPEPVQKSSSTSIGGGDNNSPPPEPPKPPAELRRAWALRVKKAALVEGDRPLPQAGFLYFPYGGKAKGIHSLELIYSGPAGKTKLDLQP